jgi:hypothetical protein
MSAILIADSGSTKCEWCLLEKGKKKKILTTAISPYFVTPAEMMELLSAKLLPKIGQTSVKSVQRQEYERRFEKIIPQIFH